MKKIISLLLTAIITLSLFSCSSSINPKKWNTNFNEAKIYAEAKNKRIFLFFSQDDKDKKSETLKNNVFNTEEFLKAFTDKYVLVNIDFSDSRYQKEQENMRSDEILAEIYDAKGVPSFYILSSEGFVITGLAIDETYDFNKVKEVFDKVENDIVLFEEKLAKTKNGSTEERLAAINEIFDYTDPALAYHLRPLNELYISLDPDNKSGQYTKHLIALTYAKAEESFMNNEPEKACEEFANIANDKNFTTDDKQMAYYTAGYLLIQSGTNNLNKVLEFFQKAYDINPESEAGINIKNSLDYVTKMANSMEESASKSAETNTEASK